MTDDVSIDQGTTENSKLNATSNHQTQADENHSPSSTSATESPTTTVQPKGTADEMTTEKTTDNEKEMEASGINDVQTDTDKVDSVPEEESSTSHSPSNHNTENRQFKNEENYQDRPVEIDSPVETHEGQDMEAVTDDRNPSMEYAALEAPNGSNNDDHGQTLATTPIPLEDEGLIPLEHNRSEEASNSKVGLQVPTTVPTYFKVCT